MVSTNQQVQNILSNPTAKINNVIVMPKANSISVCLGMGEKKVIGISAGGGFSSIAVSTDVSTKIGKIKFSLYSTAENIALFRAWHAIDINLGNTVSLSDGEFHIIGIGCIVITDPDITFEPEGAFEVEFHCRQLQ